MLKLMKYEFKKQAFSKYVIFALIALVEVLFFIGVILDRENMWASAFGIFTCIAIGAFFYVSFESILTYSNDLKTKTSYMLFLTPHTSFSIIGAKVITAAFQIILVGLAFLGVTLVNGTVLLAKYDQLDDFMRMVREFIKYVTTVEINYSDFVLLAFVVITWWISTIAVSFLAITISTTILANSKFKGFLSFVIFIGIIWIFNEIIGRTIGASSVSFNQTYMLLSSLMYLVFTVITYIGTALLLDKKVSV